MKSLNEIIGQAKLTKVGTIIARYILDHTTEACFMTSTELADTLDVSEGFYYSFFPAQLVLVDIWIFRNIYTNTT